MKVGPKSIKATGTLKTRIVLALVTFACLAWMTVPAVAQQIGAYAGPIVEPEVFEGSLFVPQSADASQSASAPVEQKVVEQTVLPEGEDSSDTENQLGPMDAALDDGTESAEGASATPAQFLDPDPTFEGISAAQTGFSPPDTQGDVGPNHYIQVVNSAFRIWDKDGNALTPVTNINALWATAGDAQAACRDSNSGDPIVLYDHLADVWLITKFTRPHFAPSLNPAIDPDWQCIAVSRGPNPVNDGWYLYQFAMVDEAGNNFSHDYPKFGTWPDGYYMGSQEGFYGGDLNLVVFDRANMINGNPAGTQSLDGGNLTFFWLPADLEGPPPPPGTPNYFVRQLDGDYRGLGIADSIQIVGFVVDWQNPANTTLNFGQLITVLPFDERLCGGGDPGLFQYCIPQAGSGDLMETLSVWPMARLQYRNFGDRDTLVFNHSVNADGNGTAGVRWYELERSTPGTGPWTVRQQGTYSPQQAGNSQPEHRWMGSIAMDRFGNLALGYSVSSTNLIANGDAVDGYPSIRYTGRLADAPLGLMPENEVTLAQGENPIINGGNIRWGDYSDMSVDPVDDCTFWYTQQYQLVPGNAFSWNTRIGAFSFADCSADLSVSKWANPSPATAGGQITYTINVHNAGVLDATNVTVTDWLPAGFSFVSDSLPGAECADTTEPTIVCNLGDISAGSGRSFTITASIDSGILQPSGPTTFDNLVKVAGDQNDPNESNDSFTLSTLINESADLQVEKICKPDGPAIAGEDQGKCEIFITNHGPSMARNARLIDEIFSSAIYTVNYFADTGGVTCVQPGKDIECDLGDMEAGQVIKITVLVNSDVANDINDLATASSDTPDPDTSNNSDEGQINFIVPTADLVVTKQCQPVTPAPAGSTAFCEIFVYNNGPQTAENVVLDDQIASDGEYTVTDVTTTAGTCSPAPATPTVDADVLCDLGNVASGDTVSIVVDFTSVDEVDVDDIATATSDTDDPDPNNNTATGSVAFQGIADLQIRKIDVSDPATAGLSFNYILRVDNHGPSAAVNTVITDYVPAGTVTEAVVTTGNGGCVIGVAGDPARPTECGVGEIASGDFALVRITVFVLPETRGVLHNDATVSSDYYDDNNINNRVTEDTTINVVVSLVLDKLAEPGPNYAGSELKYLLTLTNGGPSTAMDVVLRDYLPVETSFVGVKVLGGFGNCLLESTTPDVVACTLGNLGPNQEFRVIITVLVDPSVPDGTLITNQAQAFSIDGNSNFVSIDTLINALADLWIDKTGGFITQNPGKDIRYTLTVHNDSGCSGDDPQVCGDGGPSDAQNVTVFDQLPATNKKLVVTFVSEDCLYDYDTHTVTCVTPTLAAGDTVFHEIEATPRGRLRAITNIVDVTSTTDDPNTNNNHDEMLLIVGGGGQKGTGE